MICFGTQPKSTVRLPWVPCIWSQDDCRASHNCWRCPRDFQLGRTCMLSDCGRKKRGINSRRHEENTQTGVRDLQVSIYLVFFYMQMSSMLQSPMSKCNTSLCVKEYCNDNSSIYNQTAGHGNKGTNWSKKGKQKAHIGRRES